MGCCHRCATLQPNLGGLLGEASANFPGTPHLSRTLKQKRQEKAIKINSPRCRLRITREK